MMKHKNGYIGLAVLAILISVIAFAVPTENDSIALDCIHIYPCCNLRTNICLEAGQSKEQVFRAFDFICWLNLFGCTDCCVCNIQGGSNIAYLERRSICCVILGIAIISILSVQSAQTEIERVENKVNTKVSYIRNYAN